MSKKRKFEHYHGCNEDCFNCRYSDCRKSYSKMKTDKAAEYWQRSGNKTAESCPKTYTVELSHGVLRGL